MVVVMMVVMVMMEIVVGRVCLETVHSHFAVFATSDDAAVAYCDGMMLV